MTSSERIARQFGDLNVWRRDGERAPHKPLLVLYALGQWQRGRQEVRFSDVDRDVGELLREFGPPRATRAGYPFWRLQNDGVWAVDAPEGVTLRARNKEPLVSELRKFDVGAGFTRDVREALGADGDLVSRISRELLHGHFPESMHADIAAAVGLEMAAAVSPRRSRDPKFRPRVLVAYEYRCCVCGFDGRLGTVPIALDAAHIRWHQANGPDVEQNGMALCSLHHKTFDLGAFTVDADLNVQVSDELLGSAVVTQHVHAHHGRPIRAPQHTELRPSAEFLSWHREQVFRGRPRSRRPA